MQNIFYEVGSLDKRAYDTYALNEDILMEHAANNMALFIRKYYAQLKTVLIVCGGGNNGADGIALARLLQGYFEIELYLHVEPRSKLARLQHKRISSLGITPVSTIRECDIVIDALYGSGLSREFDAPTNRLLQEINSVKALKIACDIPSGIRANSFLNSTTFNADITLTMGALKLSLFNDNAKDLVGEIHVLDLGLARVKYEKGSNIKLLDESDCTLPFRNSANSHKGSYGHLALLCGEKSGASILSAQAALRFGSGLVTLISNENPHIPYELMLSHVTPTNCSAIALGMGLGNEFSDKELESILDNDIALLLDADIFSNKTVLKLLKRDNVVITPHPKEFVSLLKLSDIADITISMLQENRFSYVELFMQKYPHVTLLLKGANVIIAYKQNIFINPHGTNVLAKGGSGDVLSGLIASLLSQGYSPLQASISGSLAHSKLAKAFKGNNYALTPNDLINEIAHL